MPAYRLAALLFAGMLAVCLGTPLFVTEFKLSPAQPDSDVDVTTSVVLFLQAIGVSVHRRNITVTDLLQ